MAGCQRAAIMSLLIKLRSLAPCQGIKLAAPSPSPFHKQCSTALLGDNEGALRVVDVRAPSAGCSLGPALGVHAKKINTVHFEPTQEQVGWVGWVVGGRAPGG